MKLILHIGTHKTGSTALQQFLYANRPTLETFGLHYATAPHGVCDSNPIANALNVGQTSVVQAYLEKHEELARRRGCDTILVSAENFYAMTVQAAMQRRQSYTNAVKRDQTLIKTLHSVVPSGVDTVQIVCYFRRPDRYAESLYSQHVKRGVSFDGTFDEFLPLIRPALLYNTCLRAWSDVFGIESCTVRIYECAKGDVVSDFLRNVLHVDDIGRFSQIHNQANERVSRDMLEFKRLKNRTARFSERDMERTILRLLDEEMELRRAEPDCYQDFLSPQARARLLSFAEPEIEALRASHGVSPFPPFDLEDAKAKWKRYPGLDSERRRAIESHYDLINRRFGFRFERVSLRSAALLRSYVPRAGVLLDVLRSFGAKHALRRVARRIQLGDG
jgi:hypothetical protein